MKRYVQQMDKTQLVSLLICSRMHPSGKAVITPELEHESLEIMPLESARAVCDNIYKVPVFYSSESLTFCQNTSGRTNLVKSEHLQLQQHSCQMEETSLLYTQNHMFQHISDWQVQSHLLLETVRGSTDTAQ